jgi:CubicO group peptidase (beta-lactamase class C family)
MTVMRGLIPHVTVMAGSTRHPCPLVSHFWPSRVTGKSVGQNLSERIWSRLGVEQDAFFTVDLVGNEFAGGGLNTGLRDLARFGEMMGNDGRAGGQQIVPKAVVDDIRKGGNKDDFVKAGYALRSHPYAANAANDPTTLPAFHALGKYLIGNSR